MEREGPVYGYSLADRVSDRTDGAWRPGAGAIYPALQTLVKRGFARGDLQGRRRIYTVTPAGRAFLRRLRANWMGGARSGPDLGMIWSEIAGSGDPGQHLLQHLRHHLEGITSYIERDPRMPAGAGPLREQVQAELRVTLARLDALAPTSPSRARRHRTGGG
ncbi:MAG: PadR family transcriptional regulator [Thermoplasmata archaeon]